VRRTLLALLACILGSLPLTRLVDGGAWLIDLWAAMAVALVPAVLLRLRRAPGALQIWPGLALLVCWLTARFVHAHAVLGFLPGSETWHDLNGLLDDLHNTMNHEVAPVQATVAVRLSLCLLMALITVLIDLVAVVGRHGALAGLPLLIILTVCGAVTRTAVPWPMFALGAVGFLILLGMDSGDDLVTWGHRVARAASSDTAAQPASTPLSSALRGSAPRGSAPRGRAAITRAGSAITAPWVAGSAVVLALLASLLVPSGTRNLISDAIRNPNGKGDGGSTGTSINPFAKLKGDLSRTKTITLADVTISPSTQLTDTSPTPRPFYLRTAVLSRFEDDGWVSDGPTDDSGEPISSANFETLPDAGGSFVTGPVSSATFDGSQDIADGSGGYGSSLVTSWDADQFAATVKVLKLTGNPPVFAVPTAVNGLDGNAEWSPLSQTLIDDTVSAGEVYTMDVNQPRFSADALSSAMAGDQAQAWTSLPAIPQQVRGLVDSIGGTDGTYSKARAINDYFTNPANGFVYSLTTKAGDSGSDLVDFLTNKQGFCQQYAAAEAVMFRLAGIPARVVLGYAHDVPDQNGTFTITSDDAHAWVEAFFSGFGWVPFDPTPLDGISGGSANDLPWAPHPTPASTGLSATSSNDASRNPVTQPRKPTDNGNNGSDNAASANITNVPVRWIVLGIIIAMLLVVLALPAIIRERRRRRRLRRAARVGPEPLWEELADTVTDLGYLWSPARTPQQVSLWLADPAGPAAAALAALAQQVEHSRYAPPAESANASAAEELRAVRHELLRELPLRERITLWLAPPSVLGFARWRTRQH
jgi:transglutaminase-like putative cysteine protease